MWNRVALLTAGVAFGWSLVTCFSASDERLRRTQVNLALAALAGIGFVLWLGIENTAAAFVGTFVYGTGAVVAYAAHAQQILRPPEPPPLPPPTDSAPEKDERLAVLVVPGPPSRYSPAAIARLQASGSLPPRLFRHWFLAPETYRQIRRAYRKHSPLPVLKAIQAIREHLQGRLGKGWHVEIAYLNDETPLEQRLVAWQDQGYQAVALLPVDATENERAEIVSVARRSATSDLALARVAPVVRLLPDGVYRDTLEALIGEAIPPPCPTPDLSAVEELARHAESALS